MSFVLSRFFTHYNRDRGTTGILKSYARDNKFYLEMKHQGKYGGMQTVDMAFSVREAKELNTQLNEFIAQHRGWQFE